MTRLAIRLAAASLAVAAVALATLASSTGDAEAHPNPLEDLAATGSALVSAINAGGFGPSTAQIQAFGQAAMEVEADAPNHPECASMGSLGSSAVSTYEDLHAAYLASGGAATAATYSSFLTALQAITGEAEALAAMKQASEPEPEPTPEETPVSTPESTPEQTPESTPVQTPEQMPAAPAAADTGDGVSGVEVGGWLLLATLGLASVLVTAGRLATRRTRS